MGLSSGDIQHGAEHERHRKPRPGSTKRINRHGGDFGVASRFLILKNEDTTANLRKQEMGLMQSLSGAGDDVAGDQ